METKNEKCERCGYIASNMNKLIKHIKDERMCRPILSSISHTDLLNKLQPPPNLTCQFCNLLCKSKGSYTTHIKYHCHLNPERVDIRNNKNNNIASTSDGVCKNSNKTNETTTIRKYFHKHTSNTSGLIPFNQDIDWSKITIPNDTLMNFFVNKEQGIIDLFILIHSNDEHKNIEWINDKLVIFDGKGWTEVDDNLLATHLGFLYSYLEECWCNYLMDVRCEKATVTLDEEVVNSIDDFIYNKIVDDESVLFHCGNILSDYLHTLKTC